MAYVGQPRTGNAIYACWVNDILGVRYLSTLNALNFSDQNLNRMKLFELSIHTTVFLPYALDIFRRFHSC